MNIDAAKAIVEAGKKLGYGDDIIIIDENYNIGPTTTIAVKGIKYFITKAVVFAGYLEGKAGKDEKECSLLNGILWYWDVADAKEGTVVLY